MSLYKYTDSVGRYNILNKGVIKIGSFRYYREIESPYYDLKDRWEGKVVFSQVFCGSFSWISVEKVPYYLQGAIRIEPGGKFIKQNNKKLKIERVVNIHGFVFSLSTEFSLFLMKKMKYSYCLELRKVSQFVEVIRDSLEHIFKMRFRSVRGSCVYRTSVCFDSAMYHPIIAVRQAFFCKPKCFEYQKEYRLIWVPEDFNKMGKIKNEEVVYISGKSLKLHFKEVYPCTK